MNTELPRFTSQNAAPDFPLLSNCGMPGLANLGAFASGRSARARAICSPRLGVSPRRPPRLAQRFRRRDGRRIQTQRQLEIHPRVVVSLETRRASTARERARERVSVVERAERDGARVIFASVGERAEALPRARARRQRARGDDDVRGFGVVRELERARAPRVGFEVIASTRGFRRGGGGGVGVARRRDIWSVRGWRGEGVFGF